MDGSNKSQVRGETAGQRESLREFSALEQNTPFRVKHTFWSETQLSEQNAAFWAKHSLLRETRLVEWNTAFRQESRNQKTRIILGEKVACWCGQVEKEASWASCEASCSAAPRIYYNICVRYTPYILVEVSPGWTCDILQYMHQIYTIYYNICIWYTLYITIYAPDIHSAIYHHIYSCGG